MTAFPRTGDTFDVTERWNRDERPPSVAIAEAIAAIEDTDPTEIDLFLNDFVDPDALDRLFLAATGGDLGFELRVRDVLVTIRADGSLGIQQPEGHETDRSPAKSAAASQLP